MRVPAPLIVALATMTLLGCSKSKTPTPDGGYGDGGPGSHDGGPDAGPVDAGPPPCSSDSQCTSPQICDSTLLTCVAPCPWDDACGVGRICDASTGHCSAATTCDPSSGSDPCSSTDSNDLCWEKGDQCVCQVDTRADAGANHGYCERVRPLCSPCTTDAQCSTCPTDDSACNTNNFVYPAACAPVHGAGDYCLQKTVPGGSCPQGDIPDPTTHTCQPQSGVCSSGTGCASDSDCSLGQLCDVSDGLCIEACSFDFVSTSSKNCPGGQVCDVLPAFVLPDSGLLNYGLGHCEQPCNTTGGEDCAAVGATVGLTFACVTEGDGEHRCRPVDLDAGVTCMNDLECPRTSDGGPYAGYCDLYAFACAYDCRNGVDPITGTQYASHDCSPPAGSSTSYDCRDAQCVQKSCLELGGAQFGATDEFCCGEDRDHTGYDDAGYADLSHPANACPPGVDAGDYYLAPSTPWCQPTCSTSEVDFPDGGLISGFQESLDTCSVDAGLPSFDTSPNICSEYVPGTFACVIAAPFLSECPSGWSFSPVIAGCQTNSDCDYPFPDGGSTDGGVCFTKSYPDAGIEAQYCACNASQPEREDAGPGVLGPYLIGGAECPADTRCYQGKQCVYTVGCTPTFGACAVGLNP